MSHGSKELEGLGTWYRSIQHWLVTSLTYTHTHMYDAALNNYITVLLQVPSLKIVGIKCYLPFDNGFL